MNENYKQIISENLDNVLESSYIPELGEPLHGKIRDIYFVDDKVVMITSDKVSAFDQVLDRCIPYKGVVLNAISTEMMKLAKSVVPTAMIESPDPNFNFFIVQKRMDNVGVECIVRGYVWGGLAGDYEAGEMQKCGIQLPKGMLRYQKLEEPMFTPTTKAPKGQKDEDMTIAQMHNIVSKGVAEALEDISLHLFEMYSAFAASKGLILIDTKYEFGLDENRHIYLIDEATTPDSSRFCEISEWENKFPLIQEEMATGNYENVSKLIDPKLEGSKPELKIKEESKQFVRDVLLGQGYEKGQPISLTDEQVIETSLRYITLFEKITGKKFDFEANKTSEERLRENLRKAGYIKR